MAAQLGDHIVGSVHELLLSLRFAVQTPARHIGAIVGDGVPLCHEFVALIHIGLFGKAEVSQLQSPERRVELRGHLLPDFGLDGVSDSLYDWLQRSRRRI